MQLIERYKVGELTDQEHAELAQWLRADETNRELFLAEIDLYRTIRGALLNGERELAGSAKDGPRELAVDLRSLAALEASTNGGGPVDITEELARREAARLAEAHPQLAVCIEPEPRPRQIVIPKSLFYGSIAALLLFGAFLVTLAIPEKDRSESMHADATAAVVSRVIDSHNAVWANNSTATTFAAGDSAELSQGFVEVAFARGARVLIEGPCRFTVKNDNAIYVHSGRLVAEVPPSARLFAIETPMANVVDFGTEFGLNMDLAGQTEVAVFQGEVELSERAAVPGEDARNHRLTTGQMSRVSAGNGLEESVDDFAVGMQSAFIRRMEDADDPTIAYARAMRSLGPIAYWPLRGSRETLGDALGNKGYVLNKDGTPLDQWSPGPESLNTDIYRTDAASIDGQHGFYFAGPFPAETWQDNEYSIVMWMRVNDLRQQNVVALVEELDTRNRHFSNQVRLNAQGRLEHYTFFPTTQNPGLDRNLREYIQSDQKIQANQWVHVVSSYGQGRTRLYLNGRLVAEKEVGLRFESSYKMLVIGASTGLNLASSEPIHAMPQFNGSLCDLAMFNRMLHPEEVAHLFNSPAPSW